MPRNYDKSRRDLNETCLLEYARKLWPNCVTAKMRPKQGFDILLVTAYGNLIVEIKQEGETLTEVEEKFKSKTEEAGGLYWIWRTADDVIETWRKLRALK